MNLLDALMAGFGPLAELPLSEATLATVATSATFQHPCGFAADSEGCDSLRQTATVAAESQKVAACRSDQNRPQSLYPCGLSQKSQVSQGWVGTNTISAEPALDAAYQAHHFACASCKAAGRGDSYGSRCDTGNELWSAYTASCAISVPQEASKPIYRQPPIRFTPDERARLSIGADPGEIETMALRLDRLARQGIEQDTAERLADKLMLRDRDGDERRMCIECSHLRGGRCGNRQAAGIGGPDVGRDLAMVLQRCGGFTQNLKDDPHGKDEKDATA